MDTAQPLQAMNWYGAVNSRQASREGSDIDPLDTQLAVEAGSPMDRYWH